MLWTTVQVPEFLASAEPRTRLGTEHNISMSSSDATDDYMVPEVTHEGTAWLGCPTVKITGREGRPLLRSKPNRTLRSL